MSAWGSAVLAVAMLLTVSACESSQDKSATLKREGKNAIANQRGLLIQASNREVKVLQTAVLTDSNGTAAVVVMRNLSPAPLAELPVAIDVRGPTNKTVFQNNSPGLQQSLVSVASLPGRGDVAWVNDQVVPSGQALSVKAQVGAGGTGAPPKLPQIEVGAPKIVNDPISGIEADGSIHNSSSVTQLKLFVFCVARRGGRVVAAGRGAIAKLAAGARATYHVFLIGNPRGAQLTVDAPPTVLR
jgi:hypothetical protein